MKSIQITFLYIIFIFSSCQNENKNKIDFAQFEIQLLDAYWKQYPSKAIGVGYGKYYENLTIPDSSSIQSSISFSNNWLDSLKSIDFQSLTEDEKISFHIIENQLNSDKWYLTDLKPFEWDATIYNLSSDCDYIINQPYAPLNERLKILSQHIAHSDLYYKAALQMIKNPTKEHLQMSVQQNKAGINVLGQYLFDSIKVSTLNEEEKSTLKSNIEKTITAMKSFADSLSSILNNPNISFRDFKIGKKLFEEKFKFDIVADITPDQIYQRALEDKAKYHHQMFEIADTLWAKYYPHTPKPQDTIQLIQGVMDSIQNQHTTVNHFFDSLTNHVHRLKKFIIEKNLFDFDTTNPPVIVRLMPEYARGFAIASAEFTPPYQNEGATYYNIDDLSQYPVDKALGSLKEYNDYASQLLSIHEAIPGHCLQGIYNNKKTKDIVRAVFQNGTMIEGWAVYTESMMIENGWGDDHPEMQLALCKLKLRELGNVLVDYQIHCLGKTEKEILKLLTKDCFQTQAQASEKYHRATISQVQLCSYYTGAIAILELREKYKTMKGKDFQLKDFHEHFLSYGSSPIKYIGERMLSK
ncbi:MAG TPA: DUF885 domain-containing protein [Chitinophagaceae bacterium]|nr:MAG: hypothetical protein UZ11_BCD004000934 [Bacteroidetes bacterium OLB11]HMN32290.1 DUF885 domain-containing protein [Chitinophagaceae bacterium]